MILTPAVSPAARAGPELWSFNRVRPVIAINSGNHPIFKINPQQAPPATVMGRTAGADHYFIGERSQAGSFFSLFPVSFFYFFKNCFQSRRPKIL